MARNTFAARLRAQAKLRRWHEAWQRLPSHYMQPKDRQPPMTTSEAGKLRWAGLSKEERSEIARRAVLHRWHPPKKKKKRPLKESP